MSFPAISCFASFQWLADDRAPWSLMEEGADGGQ